MLAELTVHNFALIERLELAFGPGLNVISGETGAGKSILVGAINLILGGRASADLIRRGADEAEVTAVFTLPEPERMAGRFEELGLPAGDEVVIRRVMPVSGRNRVYVNGAPATLAQLAGLSRDLVSLSSQHEHQQLLDPDRQLLILDQFGGLTERRRAVADAFEAWTAAKAHHRDLTGELDRWRQQAELSEFQAHEIEAAGLAPGEDKELEQERHLLRNAEKIFGLLQDGYNRLYAETGAVIEVLDAVRGNVDQAAGFDDSLAPTLGQIEEAFHLLDDAAGALRSRLEDFHFDPVRLDQVEERLSLINRLKRKYGPELDDVIEYGRSAGRRLADAADLEQRCARAAEDEAVAADHMRQAAEALSSSRKEVADDMAGRVAEQLRSLGMPDLEFNVALARLDQIGPAGADAAEFMISPNLGEDLKPMSKIASGGELSRIMLGLKSLLAGQDRVQTVIFDEVDAGIGGAIAEVVGRKIQELAQSHQLVCITHLPQIAAFGRHHHRVSKAARNGRTVTEIKPLSAEDKVREIARMLGGAEPSAATLAAAEEMVVKADEGAAVG